MAAILSRDVKSNFQIRIWDLDNKTSKNFNFRDEKNDFDKIVKKVEKLLGEL